jgi:two-component system sensor histidine kinase RegB
MRERTKWLKMLESLVPEGLDQSALARLGLQRLLLLRALITIFSAVGVVIFQSLSSITVPASLVIALLLVIALSLGFGLWRLTVDTVISQRELFGHLLIDVVVLVVLLSNTGGASNPLISYLLVLLAITLGGILIYSYFLLRDISSGHSMPMGSMDQDRIFELHLVGMWIIFSVSAVLISVFLTRMSAAIRDRELTLAEARENELRNEQLVAIGTLAAGTAHALGTPLSTMSVLLSELDNLDEEQLKASHIKEDISLLRQQVVRCKDSLNQLIRYYHKNNPAEEESLPLSDFASDISDYITNIHPSAKVNFVIETEADPVVISDQSVKHAVINIIENGIKAASQEVNISFKLSRNSQIEISIDDDGPGIPAKVMENMGEPFISTRKDSMGLGIFLANAAIQRIGGSIEMFNLKLGGALTLIRLPMAKIKEA